MDLESGKRRYDYSRARDAIFEATDSERAPWNLVKSYDKKRARLNFIHHLLSLVPNKELPRDRVQLPRRQAAGGYTEPAHEFKYIPELLNPARHMENGQTLAE
jgi:hypothetical protein